MVEGEQFGGGSGESTSAPASGQGFRRCECEGYPYSSRARLAIRAIGEPASRAPGASPGDDVPYHTSVERTIAAETRWWDKVSLSPALLAGRAAEIPCPAFSPSAASAPERRQRAHGKGAVPVLQRREPRVLGGRGGELPGQRSHLNHAQRHDRPQAAGEPNRPGDRGDGLSHPRCEREARRGEGADDPGRQRQRAGFRSLAGTRKPYRDAAGPGARSAAAAPARSRLGTAKMTTASTRAVVRLER